jgi:hypothetical protein
MALIVVDEIDEMNDVLEQYWCEPNEWHVCVEWSYDNIDTPTNRRDPQRSTATGLALPQASHGCSNASTIICRFEVIASVCDGKTDCPGQYSSNWGSRVYDRGR